MSCYYDHDASDRQVVVDFEHHWQRTDRAAVHTASDTIPRGSHIVIGVVVSSTTRSASSSAVRHHDDSTQLRLTL